MGACVGKKSQKYANREQKQLSVCLNSTPAIAQGLLEIHIDRL